MRKSILAKAAALIAAAASSTFAAAQTPVADRIRYDSHCFTINGHDTLIYSGAFHYFRCPKQLWPARLQSMKSAGLNTLETYVAWNWHERTPPTDVNDMSKLDLTDLHDFLDLAIHQFGFNVILRPGPYICAEWDGGGYPQWLHTKQPAGFHGNWLRGDDPQYLAWAKHWYDAVAKTAGEFQINRQPAGRPGIILWQLENEYNYDGHPDVVKLHQLQSLAHVSRDDGIDVPLFTCVTESKLFRKDPYLLANVIDTRNDYPGFDYKEFIGNIDSGRSYQPEKPLMMTELQGGWFAQVGGQLSQAKGYTAAQITHLTMLAWAHGYTSTNYYMMFGGTNFGDWAADGITTTYDYAAPLREPGGVDERYQAVAGMAKFIQQHGVELARAELEKSHVEGDAPTHVSWAVRRSTDGTRFIFVFDDSATESAMGTLKLTTDDPSNAALSVEVDLKPFDAKVLVLPSGVTDTARGRWLPELPPLPQRPKVLPAAIVVKAFKQTMDASPIEWKPVTGDHSAESAGVYDRRFLYYRATLPQKRPFTHAGLAVTLGVKSTVVAVVNGSPAETREGQSGTVIFPVSNGSTAGSFRAVYNDEGRPNFGSEVGIPSGILDLKWIDQDAADQPIGTWKTRPLAKGENAASALKDDASAPAWKPFKPLAAEELKPNQSAAYEGEFDWSDADQKAGKTLLTIGRIDDRGEVYLNGKKIASSSNWQTPVAVDLKTKLDPGKNVLLVIVHNIDGAGGLGGGITLTSPSVDKANELPYEIGTPGIADGKPWYDVDLDDSHWADASDATQTPGAITWSRFHFRLPPPPAHAWVPLKLRLTAVGDGFLYLNGHPLGRWWERGPQTDFFLPECWLTRDGDNVVAVSLLSSKPSGVKAASVLPYDDLSEVRP